MFILFDAFQRTDRARPLDDRLGEALEVIGCSITLTSLTDGLAFCVGSVIDLPAISSFCIAAGIATLSVFVVQATFFASILGLDARREQANRLDLLPCCHGPAPSLSSTLSPPADAKATIGHGHVAGNALQGEATALGAPRLLGDASCVHAAGDVGGDASSRLVETMALHVEARMPSSGDAQDLSRILQYTFYSKRTHGQLWHSGARAHTQEAETGAAHVHASLEVCTRGVD